MRTVYSLVVTSLEMILTLPPLGGLPFTAHEGHDSSYAHQIAMSILYLLQLDRSPVALCGHLHDKALALPSTGPMCLLPLATKINILSSVALPQNVERLSEAITLHRDKYLGWELRHFEATMAFAAFNFIRCAELCADALKQEPRDAFTARLLFISSFHCGKSCLLADSLKVAISCVGPEYIPKPYYLGLLGFALNEAAIGTSADALSCAMEGIALVEEYNSSKLLDESWIHPFAVHAVCHVLATNPEEGLRYVETVIDPSLWVGSSFFAIHLYYHIITLLMDCNRLNEADAMYNDKLWPLVHEEDLYTLSDASGVLCRFKVAEVLAHNDTRPQQLSARWVRAACQFHHLSNIPFFVMNLTMMAALLEESGTHECAEAAVSRCREPFRQVFRAALSADVDALQASRDVWTSIGGSKGQVDILEKFRIWAIGCRAPRLAAEELRKAAQLHPRVISYAIRAARYEARGAPVPVAQLTTEPGM